MAHIKDMMELPIVNYIDQILQKSWFIICIINNYAHKSSHFDHLYTTYDSNSPYKVNIFSIPILQGRKLRFRDQEFHPAKCAVVWLLSAWCFHCVTLLHDHFLSCLNKHCLGQTSKQWWRALVTPSN